MSTDLTVRAESIANTMIAEDADLDEFATFRAMLGTAFHLDGLEYVTYFGMSPENTDLMDEVERVLAARNV